MFYVTVYFSVYIIYVQSGKYNFTKFYLLKCKNLFLNTFLVTGSHFILNYETVPYDVL